MLYESVQTNAHMTLIHNVTGLSVITYPGDKRLHEFRVRWGLVAETMSEVIPENTLAAILLQKLEGTVELREDISYYHRMPPEPSGSLIQVPSERDRQVHHVADSAQEPARTNCRAETGSGS